MPVNHPSDARTTNSLAASVGPVGFSETAVSDRNREAGRSRFRLVTNGQKDYGEQHHSRLCRGAGGGIGSAFEAEPA